VSLFQISHNEMPIKTYNIVQTGAKTPFGGFQDGLFKVKYHVLMAPAENKPLETPIIWQSKIAMTNFQVEDRFLFIMLKIELVVKLNVSTYFESNSCI
jgi:hypothetical protein